MRTKIFSLLIAGFILFASLPSLYELSRAGDLQPNRYFELVHNFPTDYNFYLSRIRQGIEGRWTVVEKYTSEPHAGSLIHEMYLLMGRVGGWVHVPWERSGDVYHMARLVLAVTLLALIAAFAKQSFVKFAAEVAPTVPSGLPALFWPLIAFLLAVTASSWPKPIIVGGLWRFGGYMPWWSVVDSLQRIVFIPHILAGQALIVFLVMALSRWDVRKRVGNIVFLGVLGGVLGMIFPPGLIFVYAVLGVMAGLHMLLDKTDRSSVLTRWIVPCVGFVVISAPSIVYLFVMTSIYPWKRLAEFDTIHPLPFDYVEYIKVLGPMLPLGLAGLCVAIWKKEKMVLSSVAWVIAWIVLLGVFKFVPAQSPLRFTEMLPSVPLGFLTAYLFYNLFYFYKNYNRYILILPALLIALGIFHMYSSWLWQKDFVDHKIYASFPLVPTGSYVMYPLKDFIYAIRFIQDNSTRDTVVLSGTTAGNYMPVYSGNTVYIGHDNTVAAEEKKETAKRFFAGSMSRDEARSWLAREHIGVVFFGPQEKEDLLAGRQAVGQVGGVYPLKAVYPFLHEIQNNTYVTVFTVPAL